MFDQVSHFIQTDAAQSSDYGSQVSSGRTDTAVLPPTHLRGTDLTLNCDVMLVGDICITASHVVGRGLRNKGWGAAEQSFPHEASFLTFVPLLQFPPFLFVLT